MRIYTFLLFSLLVPLMLFATESQQNKTLRTDRVWVYSCCTSTSGIGSQYNGDLEIRFARYETIVEKDYMVYVYSWGENSGEVFLREENNCIYRYLFNDEGEHDGEYLSYSFDAAKGEIASVLFGPWILDDLEFDYYETGLYVADSFDIILPDGVHKVVKYENSFNDCIVEGIGPFTNGLLPTYMCTLIPTRMGNEWYDEVNFKALKDTEDNTLFTRRMVEEAIGESLGINAIDTNVIVDGRMYDLSGREIREPQRGTVYIQGGRKMVKR